MESYLANQTDIFDVVRELLSDQGTLWLNLGDSYVSQRKGSTGGNSGLTQPTDGSESKRSHSDVFFTRYARRTWLRRKNLIGLPWRLAFALQARGWILRDCIIWNKPSALPESVRDRCTKSHEYLFMFAKKPTYYYDHEAISEPRLTDIDKPVGGWAYGEGSHDPVEHNRKSHRTDRKFSYRPAESKTAGPRRNRRSIWTIPVEPYKDSHFAAFPTTLVAPCVLAGCPAGGTVFDPYMGTGTVAAVAKFLGKHYAGIELNREDFEPLIEKRLADVSEGMDF